MGEHEFGKAFLVWYNGARSAALADQKQLSVLLGALADALCFNAVAAPRLPAMAAHILAKEHKNELLDIALCERATDERLAVLVNL